MHRAFSSVQGPAALLHAPRALADLVTNLLGPSQSGDARSPSDFGFDGEMAAGRDGAQGRHRTLLSSRKSCFLQADTCSSSAFLQWLNLPEENITTSLSKTQVLRDLGPLHLTWHGKKLTGLYKNCLTWSCSLLNFSQCAGMFRNHIALIFYLHMSEDTKSYSHKMIV